MDRRKFLKNSIIASTTISVGGVAAEGNRLFGTPNSITPMENILERKHNLRLSMSRNDIPPKMWKKFEHLSEYWNEIASNPEEYTKIREMAINEYPELDDILKNGDLNTREHKELLKMSDPLLLDYVKKGDYESLISEMNLRGLLEVGNDLSVEFIKAVKEDSELFEEIKSKSSGLFLFNDVNDSNFMNEISYFKEKITRTSSLNVQNNAVAVVGVAIATYVAVAVNVAVVLNLAVQISVAVNMAVTVGGGGGGSCDNCHGNLPVSQNMMKDIQSISLMAEKMNNTKILDKVIIRLHCKEAAMCLSAAEKIGIIRILDTDRDEVYRNLYRFIRKGLEA